MPRRFRRTVVVFHRHRSPTSCDAGCILSCASFSFRVPSDSHLLVRSRVRAPPVGSGPSSRHQHQESTLRRASRARRCSARSVSHALDGLLLPVPRAFVSPRCRVQGFAPGVCLLRPSRTTSSVAVTLAPLAPLACRLPGASERRVDLRVLLSSGVRGVRRGCSPRRHSCPLVRFQAPSGISRRPGPCHRTSSARGLDGAVLRVPRTSDPQRIDQSPCFASVPRGCSRPSFPAFESVALPVRPISS